MSLVEASRREEESNGPLDELIGLLDLIMTAANEANAEDFHPSTRDLLQAVKTDVVAFAKKCKINTRLGAMSQHYKKPLVKKMTKTYQGKSITASRRG